MNSEIELSKIEISESETLVVKVKRNKLPPSKLKEHMQNVLKAAKETFPNNKVIVCGDDIEFEVESE